MPMKMKATLAIILNHIKLKVEYFIISSKYYFLYIKMLFLLLLLLKKKDINKYKYIQNNK